MHGALIMSFPLTTRMTDAARTLLRKRQQGKDATSWLKKQRLVSIVDEFLPPKENGKSFVLPPVSAPMRKQKERKPLSSFERRQAYEELYALVVSLDLTPAEKLKMLKGFYK